MTELCTASCDCVARLCPAGAAHAEAVGRPVLVQVRVQQQAHPQCMIALLRGRTGTAPSSVRRGIMTSAQGQLVVPGLKVGNVFIGVQVCMRVCTCNLLHWWLPGHGRRPQPACCPRAAPLPPDS